MKAHIETYDPSREIFFAEGCFINELSNAADDPGVSIARARLAPGKTTRWHYLRATAERYVVLAGAGRVEVQGLAPQQVGVGDVVRIPAEARQRICNGGLEDLVFLAICSPRFTEQVYVDAEE